MAGRKQTQDFEGRFFDQLQESITEVKDMGKELARKIDDNTHTTEKGFKDLNGRVYKLERRVFNEPILESDKAIQTKIESGDIRISKEAWWLIVKIIGFVGLVLTILSTLVNHAK